VVGCPSRAICIKGPRRVGVPGQRSTPSTAKFNARRASRSATACQFRVGGVIKRRVDLVMVTAGDLNGDGTVNPAGCRGRTRWKISPTCLATCVSIHARTLGATPAIHRLPVAMRSASIHAPVGGDPKKPHGSRAFIVSIHTPCGGDGSSTTGASRAISFQSTPTCARGSVNMAYRPRRRTCGLNHDQLAPTGYLVRAEACG
jgi:hypothetical protein